MTAVELGRVVDGVGGGLGVGVQEGVVVGEVVEVVGEGGEREGGFACAGGAGEERGAVVVADRAGVDEVVSGLGEREVQRGAKGGGAFPPGDGVVVGDAVQDCVLGRWWRVMAPAAVSWMARIWLVAVPVISPAGPICSGVQG
jgi:hypothetical protein